MSKEQKHYQKAFAPMECLLYILHSQDIILYKIPFTYYFQAMMIGIFS